MRALNKFQVSVSSMSVRPRLDSNTAGTAGGNGIQGIVEGRYEVRLAEDPGETAAALRLRHKVFSVEIGGEVMPATGPGIEFDAYDFRSLHLIVIDHETGETVGTYRLNTIETAGGSHRFYSANEFTICDLPADVLQNGVEIGRACVAKEHRNTKVLFLLWKGLLRYLATSDKRYFFGCCSMFTQNEAIGAAAYRQMLRNGAFHDEYWVTPCKDRIDPTDDSEGQVELPSLFNMYLRLGAKVCGPPMIDREFGTIDFFVLFDVTKLNAKYRRMFAA